MPQSFTCLHYHLVFSTKHRLPQIAADLAPRLYAYLGGILRSDDGCLVAAGGMPDHVHLLARLSKQASVADALRLLKANSSKWIHATFPERQQFSWQAGYGAFSVSFSNLPDVRNYIARQAEHHRVRTFQDEFREFLRRHDLEWDERYVWD